MKKVIVLIIVWVLFLKPFNIFASNYIIDTTSKPYGKWTGGFYINPLIKSKKVFNVEFTPFIGYYLTRNILAGLGPVYVYEKGIDNQNKTVQFNTFGGRLLLQLNVTNEINPWIGKIVLTSETELLDRKYFSLDKSTIQQDWIFSSFIGSGLKTDFSRKDNVTEVFLMLQYNYLYQKREKYKYYEGSPFVFRLGFIF
jgi:hypothetical protein